MQKAFNKALTIISNDGLKAKAEKSKLSMGFRIGKDFQVKGHYIKTASGNYRRKFN